MPMPAAPETIATIDCHYTAPQRAAVYLLQRGGQAAFIDTNTRFAAPLILERLRTAGLSPADVAYIIVTHVHLDHSGGTAELAKHCPNAEILCHPRAVRHLIDPERLVAGAKAVYGVEEFEALYGVIEPVPASRIRAVEDNETLVWNHGPIRFLHTRGHANHHICIYDELSRGVFTGDNFGAGLTPDQRPGPAFRVCAAAPADFDPEEARISLRRIMALGATQAYPTHYGIVRDLALGAEQLLRSIGQMEEVLESAVASEVPDQDLEEFCRPLVAHAIEDHLRYCAVEDFEKARTWLSSDVRLNAMGVAFVAQRRRREQREVEATRK